MGVAATCADLASVWPPSSFASPPAAAKIALPAATARMAAMTAPRRHRAPGRGGSDLDRTKAPPLPPIAPVGGRPSGTAAPCRLGIERDSPPWAFPPSRLKGVVTLAFATLADKRPMTPRQDRNVGCDAIASPPAHVFRNGQYCLSGYKVAPLGDSRTLRQGEGGGGTLLIKASSPAASSMSAGLTVRSSRT